MYRSIYFSSCNRNMMIYHSIKIIHITYNYGLCCHFIRKFTVYMEVDVLCLIVKLLHTLYQNSTKVNNYREYKYKYRLYLDIKISASLVICFMSSWWINSLLTSIVSKLGVESEYEDKSILSLTAYK